MKRRERVFIRSINDLFGFDELRLCVWVITACGLIAIVETEGSKINVYATTK